MRDTLTVYYNGACPICGAEIRHYQALASRSAAPLAWVDIDRQPDALEAHAICGDMAKRRLYAKLQDGSLVAGVAAFALLWQRLPRYRWLGGVATAPLVRPVAECVYERILAPGLYRFDRWRTRRRTAAPQAGPGNRSRS